MQQKVVEKVCEIVYNKLFAFDASKYVTTPKKWGLSRGISKYFKFHPESTDIKTFTFVQP